MQEPTSTWVRCGPSAEAGRANPYGSPSAALATADLGRPADRAADLGVSE